MKLHLHKNTLSVATAFARRVLASLGRLQDRATALAARTLSRRSPMLRANEFLAVPLPSAARASGTGEIQLARLAGNAGSAVPLLRATPATLHAGPPLGVVSLARFKPCEGVLFFAEVKVPDARLNKVTGDARDDLQEPAIGDRRYAFNLSMMIGDEFEMRYKGTEAFPSGKRFRMDHNADKFSVRCDERVDLFCESLEVRSLKRAFGGNEKNTTVSQQFKSDHLSTHSLSSGCNPPWTTACAPKQADSTERSWTRIL